MRFFSLLVTFVGGFELIVDVYDEVLPDMGKRVFLWIYLTSVTVTFKGRRTKQIKKGGLELSLVLSVQDRCGYGTHGRP